MVLPNVKCYFVKRRSYTRTSNPALIINIRGEIFKMKSFYILFFEEIINIPSIFPNAF